MESTCVLLLCAPGGSYLDHSLVGKREDLLRPLFLYVHQAVGLGDVLLSRQELAVEDDRCLVNHDALPLQEAAETTRRTHQKSARKTRQWRDAVPSAHCSVIPWTSFCQSFCSLSDRQVTLVGGGVEAVG